MPKCHVTSDFKIAQQTRDIFLITAPCAGRYSASTLLIDYFLAVISFIYPVLTNGSYLRMPAVLFVGINFTI
ncbi:hypothetical protein N7508_011029 [Penicillium antarcticum]|uniref:uncharacterized protein n=1 Tax=Penicillium antarcticum TaxID=416450 RepID=UPI002389B2E5|nr:uncharacterized protein N7508_011029 [Penicillium antarcticum]KAJ5296208.1 hypothetical protein N7508_011029 [Penicillium antarcticum]